MDFAALDTAVMGTFGERERIAYQPRSGPGFDIAGIYDRYQVEVPGEGDSPPMIAARTTLSIRAADLPEGFVPLARDRVLLRGVTYDLVAQPEPDGTGWYVLHLGRIG